MESPGPAIPEWVRLWDWGKVPPDPDVRPFTMVQRAPSKEEKKRHHFVSDTYMQGFCDEGLIWSYRMEAPEDPRRLTPNATGFEKFYYSFLQNDGTKDNNSFENRWGLIETVWPETMLAVRAKRLSHAISFNLLGMATLMRTRVPAARQYKELLLATKLREEVKALERAGSLPPGLERYRGRLDEVPVGINPQESLRLMTEDQYAFGNLCFKLGFQIVHNATNVPFLTSDNPVCIYDPRRPFETRVPYEWDDEVELLFPLDAHTMLRGSNLLQRPNVVSSARTITDTQTVRRYNRTIARFAYRLLLSRDRSPDRLASIYGATVPTVAIKVEYEGKETKIIHRNVFGPMPKLSMFVDSASKAARLAPEWQLEPET
ncbi:DUF4238 domain-containing protein [Asticcacaulis sp. W401b]|uniref:DUF4238 domain-containing protein n=1 Tax=Asticcacaulis sp. W401b TaxID=3388666 RepID=UPI0039708967